MRTPRFHLTVLSLLIALVAPMLLTAPVAAQGISVTRNTVEHSFAQHVTFALEASSEAEISQVYLFFRAADDEETEKKRMELEGDARQASIRYVHDVRRDPLPPFAEVVYWWQIENTAGQQHKTPPKQFAYTDNRFSWEVLEAGGVAVHWIAGRGDPAFAQTALDVAQASLNEIGTELQAPVPDPLDIFIYDSEPNLEAAMVLTGREWVGGQARPELGVVVIAVPPDPGYSSRLKRYLPHEITHLMIYELATPEGYRNVPDWLDEGLATANEQLPTPEYALALEEARRTGQLFPLEALCVPFSPDPRAAMLSYAQSASVVTYIRDRHGATGLRRLLSAYADGASCTSGVEEALGVSFSKLESNWRMSLEPGTAWRAVLDHAGAWVGFWILTAIAAVPMVGRLRRRRSTPRSGDGER